MQLGRLKKVGSGHKKVHKPLIYKLFCSPTSPELNPLYDSLRKIYDLSQILKKSGLLPL